MKARSPVKFAIATLALFAMSTASPGVANTLATWTDTTGTHAWEVPANWDINQVPNNSTFDVRFSTSAAPTCNLSSQFQIGALSSINGTNLNLGAGSLLAIASPSGINNNGAIVVNPTAANSPTTLRFDTSAPINGSGNLQLNGINPGDATLSATGVTVTHNANHTIHGRGDISMNAGNTIFVNNGTIKSDVPGFPGGVLRISLSNALGNQNNGTLTTSGTGAELRITQGFLDQRGGGIITTGDSGKVTLGDATHTPAFLGGTFDADVIAANVALDGCTNLGFFQVSSTGLLTISANGLLNNGYLGFSHLQFDASAAITGFGQMSFYGGEISANGVTVTNGPQHRIEGHGDILMSGNNTKLINDGTVSALSATIRVFLSNSGNKNNGTMKSVGVDAPALLSFQQGTIDQTGGGTILANGTPPSRLIHPGSSASVQIGGAQTVTVIGGKLATISTPPSYLGVIQGVAAILAGNITNLGLFEVPANNFTLVTATTLTNSHTMTLNASSSLLRFDASTSIIGQVATAVIPAIILTNNATMEINNNAVNNVTNGNGHTIKGNGTIQIDSGSSLTNNGTIAPGTSAGTLNFSGNLQLSFASNLAFEIGGTTQGTDYDLLHKIDNGALTLNGTLTVTLINGFAPASSDVFTILTTQSPLGGAFTNVPSGSRLNTSDGAGSFVVTYSGNNVVLSDFGPPLLPSQLLNISTRLRVLTGNNVLIGGFIVTGSDPKKIIVRGLGPSLTNRGVSDPLLDPTLELHDSSGGIIAFNDNWKDSQQTEIQNSGIPPSNESESAIVATLPANNASYTIVLREKNGTPGVGLLEVYDLNTAANSKLANISSRGFVGTGNDVMIGGVIVGASTANSTPVLMRGLGPSLVNFGIPNGLADPILELHDPNGNLLVVNDNWKDTQESAIRATGIPPGNDAESAILATLAPGNYTAILRGANNGTGIGLVEVYDLP